MIRYYVWYRDYNDELCKVWTDAETKDEAKDNVRREWYVKSIVDCVADRVLTDDEKLYYYGKV